MKKYLIILALVAFGTLQTAYADGDVQVIKMGESYGRDSSGRSGRSFDKKLVVAKGSCNVGLQFLYMGLNTANSEALMLVTGMNGNSSLLRLAPSFGWSYANNHQIGAKIAYTNTQLGLSAENVNLLNETLNFKNVALDSRINSFTAGIFERTYFGLDKRGIFSIYLEFLLSYGYVHTDSGSSYANTHKINLAFSPGFEVFVMNNLSCLVSISLADIGFSTSQSMADGVAGTSNRFKANANLSFSALDFGLRFYF